MASVKVERGEVLCRMSKESQFVDLWSLCIIQAISRLPRICFIHLNTAILSSICGEGKRPNEFVAWHVASLAEWHNYA